MKSFSPQLLAFLMSEQGRTCLKADLFVFSFPSGQAFTATTAQTDVTTAQGPPTTYYATKYGTWERGKVTTEADFSPNSNETTILFKDSGAQLGSPILFPGTSITMVSAILQGFFDGGQVQIYTLYCPPTGADGVPRYSDALGLETKFVGTFTRAEPADRMSCTLTAADPMYLLNMQMPVRLIQSGCPFGFGDSNCGFDLGTVRESKVVANGSTQTDIFFTTNLTTARAAQGYVTGADNSGHRLQRQVAAGRRPHNAGEPAAPSRRPRQHRRGDPGVRQDDGGVRLLLRLADVPAAFRRHAVRSHPGDHPMTEEKRKQVAEEVQSWMGTPYRANQRAKQLGVDCLQFVVGVYSACGLFDPATEPDTAGDRYSIQEHWHSNDPRYVEGIARHAEQAAEPQQGDLIVMWISARQYNHSGIVVDPARHVFAHANLGRGVSLDDWTQGVYRHAPKRFYTVVQEKE